MSAVKQTADMNDPRMVRAMHPEMYVPDEGIDRHQCKRVVPMEVLSLGLSRTGTACKRSSPNSTLLVDRVVPDLTLLVSHEASLTDPRLS
jgi:hypothetical protein